MPWVYSRTVSVPVPVNADPTPVLRKRKSRAGEKSKRPLRKQQFLALLREHQDISRASRAMGIHRNTVYSWIKRDPEFERAVMNTVIKSASTEPSLYQRRESLLNQYRQILWSGSTPELAVKASWFEERLQVLLEMWEVVNRNK